MPGVDELEFKMAARRLRSEAAFVLWHSSAGDESPGGDKSVLLCFSTEVESDSFSSDSRSSKCPWGPLALVGYIVFVL